MLSTIPKTHYESFVPLGNSIGLDVENKTGLKVLDMEVDIADSLDSRAWLSHARTISMSSSGLMKASLML